MALLTAVGEDLVGDFVLNFLGKEGIETSFSRRKAGRRTSAFLLGIEPPDKRNGKPFPKTVRWRFTGSVLSQPDPTKEDKVYGADLTVTLIAIFPVTDQTVFRTNLTMEYEKFLKLETNPNVLPKEGTAVKLVIAVPRGT